MQKEVRQSIDGIKEIKLDNANSKEPPQPLDKILEKPTKKQSQAKKPTAGQDYSVSTYYAYKRAKDRQEHDVLALNNRLEFLKQQDKKIWQNIKKVGSKALKIIEVKKQKQKRIQYIQQQRDIDEQNKYEKQQHLRQLKSDREKKLK